MDKKDFFRTQAKIKLKNQKLISTKNVINITIKILNRHKCKNIFIYHALDYEYNLLKYSTILKKKFRVYSPFMQDKSLKVVKSRLPFFKKMYGIYESGNSFVDVKLDALIVPVIGVDTNMRRIGHGKGFYDRFYAGLKNKPLIIFLSLHNAKTNDVMCDKHDICGHYYINPYKIYSKKDCYDRNCYSVRRTDYRRLGRVFGGQKNKRGSFSSS